MLSYQKPRELSENALRQVVAKAVAKGWIRESFHSEHERAHRNISNEDVLHGLERSDWILSAPPNYDPDHKNWEYKIKTVDIEGEELHLKIAVNSDAALMVITKY